MVIFNVFSMLTALFLVNQPAQIMCRYLLLEIKHTGCIFQKKKSTTLNLNNWVISKMFPLLDLDKKRLTQIVAMSSASFDYSLKNKAKMLN